MELVPGSILIVVDKKKRSIVEGAIEAFTGDAHHTANVISPNEIIEATAKHGVRRISVLDFASRDEFVLVCEPLFLDKEQKQKVIARWKEWDGSKYDFGGIWYQIFKLKSPSRTKIICSRLSQYGMDSVYRVKGKSYKEFHASPSDWRKSILYEKPGIWGVTWMKGKSHA